MAQSIKLNYEELNDGVSTFLSRFNHEALSIDQSKMKIPHRDGEKQVNFTYGTRQIQMGGNLVATSISGLDGKVDWLKQKFMYAQNIPLDIEYAGSTRRYMVNVTAVMVPREHYNTTMVPFTIMAEAINPVMGQDLTTVSGYFSTAVSGTWSSTTSGITTTGSLLISGTANPQPQIVFTVNIAGSVSAFQFTNTTTNTSFSLQLGTASAGDKYVIDTRNYQVLKNGAVITTYSGTYPVFYPGVNNFTVFVKGTTPNFTYGVSTEYNAWWL